MRQWERATAEPIQAGSGCWRAARRGDQKARAYLADRAASVAGSMLRNRRDLAQVRDDLAQEAGLSLLGYLHRHEQAPRELTRFLKWRVRGVISSYRKGKRRPAPQPFDQEAHERAVRDCPSKRLKAQNLGGIVAECRASLSGRHQELLALRYDQQLSISEIAERTGARRNTVTVWLSRAKSALSEALRQRGVGAADLD